MRDHDLFGDTVTTRRRAMGSHQSASGGSDEWLTPRPLLAALGEFDLDPCAPADGRRLWDTAVRHYSIEDDGLRQMWAGRVWLNPPYAAVGGWLARLADHGQGTALVFARTETAVWHEQVWARATGLLFLRGRVTFCDIDGNPGKANAGAPSVLVAYGEGDAAVLARCGVPGRYVRLDTPLG